MHVIKTWHFFVFTLMSAILGSSLTFGGWMYVQHINTPLVIADQESERCLQVLNFANGDAYNCDDVGVVLRRYRKTYELPEGVVLPEATPASTPAPAPAPVAPVEQPKQGPKTTPRK